MVFNGAAVLSWLFFIKKYKLRNIARLNIKPRANDPNIGINRKGTRRARSLRLSSFFTLHIYLFF